MLPSRDVEVLTSRHCGNLNHLYSALSRGCFLAGPAGSRTRHLTAAYDVACTGTQPSELTCTPKECLHYGDIWRL